MRFIRPFCAGIRISNDTSLRSSVSGQLQQVLSLQPRHVRSDEVGGYEVVAASLSDTTTAFSREDALCLSLRASRHLDEERCGRKPSSRGVVGATGVLFCAGSDRHAAWSATGDRHYRNSPPTIKGLPAYISCGALPGDGKVGSWNGIFRNTMWG
jgi:hypothetical protein